MARIIELNEKGLDEESSETRSASFVVTRVGSKQQLVDGALSDAFFFSPLLLLRLNGYTRTRIIYSFAEGCNFRNNSLN